MSIALTLSAWLATYAIHSTILLTAALIASRFLRSERAKEILWKAAIVGGLFTSTLPSIAGYTPFVGRWTVGEAAPADVSTAVPTAGGARDATGPAAPAIAPAAEPSISRVEQASPQATSRSPVSWIPWAVGTWLAISLLLIVRLILHQRRLFRALRGRAAVNDGPLPGMLAELRRRGAIWTPVRLTASPACPTPIALGRSEICVPERFQTELDNEQQRTALAHELAHLKRRDPVWQLAAGFVESIFFFQPLNTLGRRRLRDAAEYLCDDWAVQQTRSPIALAQCLTHISSWVGSAYVPDGMLAIAEGGSPLVNRIQRLADWKAPPATAARVSLVVAAALIGVVATAAPVFSAVGVTSEDFSARAALRAPQRPPQSANPDTVIAYTGPQSSLEQRWSWAHDRRLDPPYWIGWEVDAVPPSAVGITSSSPGAPRPDTTAPTLAALTRTSTPSSGRAAILLRFGSRDELSATRFQRFTDPVYLGGRTLIWLGAAGTGESLSRLQGLFRTTRSGPVRAELAAAYATHADPDAAIRALGAVIGSGDDPRVRAEAVQWLARLHGEDRQALEILTSTALTEGELAVQMEAVDGLRTAMRAGSSAARDALSRIASSDVDVRVRSEALQALAAHR